MTNYIITNLLINWCTYLCNQFVSVFPCCVLVTSLLLYNYKQTKVIILFISERMYTNFLFLSSICFSNHIIFVFSILTSHTSAITARHVTWSLSVRGTWWWQTNIVTWYTNQTPYLCKGVTCFTFLYIFYGLYDFHVAELPKVHGTILGMNLNCLHAYLWAWIWIARVEGNAANHYTHDKGSLRQNIIMFYSN